MPGLRIYIKDSEGNKLTPRQAAELIEGVTDKNIRTYISNHGAKTVEDVETIASNLRKNKNHYREPKKHDTIFGELFTVQMWNIHPYKFEVSLQSLSTRISVNGALSCAVWVPRQHSKEPKPHLCSCGRKLTATSFNFIKSGLGKKCSSQKPVKQKKTTRDLSVQEGEEVVSNGRLYVVKSCEENVEGKSLVCGYRKMPNGQVFKNTVHYLQTNWEKANERTASLCLDNAKPT